MQEVKKIDINKVNDIIEKAKRENRSILDVAESKDILKACGITVNKFGVARSSEDARQLANEIGCPVVMKIVSTDPKLLHKTDMGGVAVGIATPEEAAQTFDDMTARIMRAGITRASMEGIMVEEMVEGVEIIIGTTIDPTFGPLIMTGLGGIFVEVLKDVSFRVVPITEYDAREMLDEIKAKKILEGVRGKPPVNKDAIVKSLLLISELIMNVSWEQDDKAKQQLPIIREIDINPLFATEKEVIAVDCRVILTSESNEA
ncbi:acetate--CoA ligase family protein [Candidatus Borrarchaeum sp.]|uniref:acetate--CoA ligase family protein n=1 Tax=Candidatus Borrarchaeum sp. TaxID=2846742 RepID=UPI00257F5D3A|nr:acetate--CoA ligase family protein [Candidatus Borrarchaeum sp.]